MTLEVTSRAARTRNARRVRTLRLHPGGGAGFPALPRVALWCVALILFAAGCGGQGEARVPEELVAERTLRAALAGERAEFEGLVAPSFLAQARAEMPDSDDEILGGVLIAGFLEDIPFAEVVAAEYGVETEGDRAAVYVWGTFAGAGGEEMTMSEAEAIRIPLVRENGRWYLDLLDL